MATTPEAFIAGLDEPRRGEIAQLNALIRATLPDHERVLESGPIGYGPYHYRRATPR